MDEPIELFPTLHKRKDGSIEIVEVSVLRESFGERVPPSVIALLNSNAEAIREIEHSLRIMHTDRINEGMAFGL